MLKDEISKVVSGEVLDDKETLDTYSRDASLFEVKPKLVVFPKDNSDVKSVVKFVNENRAYDKSLSITPRSAGSDMSGGPLNESIILDFTKHITGIEKIEKNSADVYPGTFYRDFEVETLKHDLILPCYTASKNLCALGGMISNNAAGEKTLFYGKMENFVNSLNVVLSDGEEYQIKPMTRRELDTAINKGDFLGGIYKKTLDLIESNREEIEKAKPNVSKNSAGYYIWNVFPKDSEVFDLTKLIVGSQGTLGLVTKANIKLEKVKKKSKLFAIFLKNLDPLGKLVNDILALNPETLESYDDATLKLAVRFFPEMIKSMKGGFLKLMFSFLPEAGMVISGGVPKLILLVEFTGEEEKEIDDKLNLLEKVVAPYKLKTHRTRSPGEANKYWTIRRESFNLLRKHIHGKRTAPFVDDVVVSPHDLPTFLPEMRKILDEYKLLYTIAGHAGNGNFHVIPLMDMKDRSNVKAILEVSDQIYDLVGKYKGSITGEHNDGIVRTPYLNKMYSPRTLEIFAEIKKIFDPDNIFNPGKKVGGSIQYLKDHLVNK